MLKQDLNTLKQEYISLLKSTNVEGIDNLLAWLETSDFFEAPSSSIYHGACKGGLLRHSLNVYNAAIKIKNDMAMSLALPEKKISEIPDKSIIIAALLHDLCKVNYYQPVVKMWKDDSAPYGQQWKKYMGYEINDKFPMGHGEKSVLIAQQFIRLTGEEMLAMRWHMGMTDPGAYLSPYEKPALMKAINDIPLVMIIMQADAFASFMMECEVDLKRENALD